MVFFIFLIVMALGDEWILLFIHILNLIDCYWFDWMNEYDWISSMPFDSLDLVVHPIRGIRFLFGCKNLFFSIDRL